ncbi:hypothetical protein [Microcoleus sp. A003_D6]|uniref:hypothetical protein n=1 Tax=Microcoleus sp. A003_D6 TaxID=3055266 RepID=UPI003FA5EEE3
MTPLNQQYGVTSSPHTSAKNESDRKRNPTNSSYTGFSLHIGGMWKRWCPNSWISLSKGHCAGISLHNHARYLRIYHGNVIKPLSHWLDEAIAKT